MIGVFETATRNHEGGSGEGYNQKGIRSQVSQSFLVMVNVLAFTLNGVENNWMVLNRGVMRCALF